MRLQRGSARRPIAHQHSERGSRYADITHTRFALSLEPTLFRHASHDYSSVSCSLYTYPCTYFTHYATQLMCYVHGPMIAQ